MRSKNCSGMATDSDSVATETDRFSKKWSTQMTDPQHDVSVLPITGRHRELWAVHNAFHPTTAPVPATRPRTVVVLRGMAGTGKTVLAEQYAALFHDAFAGGVIRLGPFGHHAPEEFLSQFQLALARAISARLDIEVSGMDLGRLRDVFAERITIARKKVLLLIDDVPAGLPSVILDHLLLQSVEVFTLITSRGELSLRGATSLDLPGLTEEEGLRLFSEVRRPVNEAERAAIVRLVKRCGGHPFTLRANAFTVQNDPGPLDDGCVLALPDTAPQAIREVMTRLNLGARRLSTLASVLAPVPFPTGLAREVLGSPDIAEFAQSVQELVSRGFATRTEGGLQIQALAAEVAGAEFEPDQFPELAAEALRRRLSEDREDRHGFLLQHARAVTERTTAHRIELLRPIAAAYRNQGDVFAAGEIYAMILADAAAAAADFIAAARIEIACGLYDEAITHARHATTLAVEGPDRSAAASIAAQALDCLGDYAAADHMVRLAYDGRRPVNAGERLRAVVAMARACRLRGRPAEAVTLLEATLPELRASPSDALRAELTPSASLEYARSLQFSGHPRRAREVAAELVAAYRAEGREHHFRCTEAELVRADAMLTLDLQALRANPSDQERWATELRELERTYEKRCGSENPLTLTATALADRALLALGQPRHALGVLGATERTVVRVLGEEHRLCYRIRHGMALALAQLHEFGRQADLLESILEPQVRLLGRTHPETLETRVDLGLALVFSGRGPRQRAIELVDSAAEDITANEAIHPDLSAKALAAKRLVQLPHPVVSALFTVEELVWPRTG
ncbi:MAG: hypothetical protein JWQ81_7719 [Amycolatopsis sp.]|nr:hypothetical protein [Amycolatopsis sp.]